MPRLDRLALGASAGTLLALLAAAPASAQPAPPPPAWGAPPPPAWSAPPPAAAPIGTPGFDTSQLPQTRGTGHFNVSLGASVSHAAAGFVVVQAGYDATFLALAAPTAAAG